MMQNDTVLKLNKNENYSQKPCIAKLCILGVYPDHLSINNNQRTLIEFGLLQARRIIALSWKEIEISSANSWIKEMAMCVTLEKLTYKR